jgi:hypothetical protein
MAKKRDTVEKAIYFGVMDWTDKHKEPIDVLGIFESIQGLPFEDGSRYFENTAGQRFEIILRDNRVSIPIYGNIGDSRRTDLPFVEDVGKLSPLSMKKGAGLYDATHFMIRKNKKGTWIIVYEFNLYAPRVSSINQYVMHQFKDVFDYPIINAVGGESIGKTLKKFQVFKKLRMGIRAGVSVADLSSGLEDAVTALKNEHNGDYIDVTIRAKRGKYPLESNIIKNIVPFFKTGIATMAMDHFYISGINRMGEKETVNLMEILLKETRTVKKMRSDYRFIDSEHMYAALDDAYEANHDKLESI